MLRVVVDLTQNFALRLFPLVAAAAAAVDLRRLLCHRTRRRRLNYNLCYDWHNSSHSRTGDAT